MTDSVKLNSISQNYGEVHALININLEIKDGEFFSLLGPSGSGKTTCLRIIAGFEPPNAGTVFLFNENVTFVPPYKRRVNTVFQDYALFPHMTVEQNVGYSLKIKGVSLEEYRKQVHEILHVVKLASYTKRRINQLSGGQKQRIALARALINKPKVLLLDEPLGALDLKLREQMQVELKSLQRQFNITFIYVTHDQQEALSMSDRIAVLNEGKIEQIGTPSEIYSSPNSSFVANFVGTSNIFDKSIAKEIFNIDSSFSIRPEKINLLINKANNEYFIDGKIIEKQFQGSFVKLIIETTFSKQLIVNLNHSNPNLSLGNEIKLGWSKEDIIMLDK